MSQSLSILALEATCDTVTDKAVLSHLATRANSEGKCWPKMSTIARAIGVSRRTVCTAIRRLEERGWITVQRSKYFNVYDVKLGSHLMTPRCEARITLDVKPGSHPIERSGKDHLKEVTKVTSSTRTGKQSMKYSRGQGKSVGEIIERIDNEKVRTLQELYVHFMAEPVKPDRVSQFWRRGCHIMFDEVQQAHLTAKQTTFLKALMKHFGKDTYARLTAILSDWPGFVKYANELDGTNQKPKIPNLGYITGHLTAALNYAPGDTSDDDFVKKYAKY